jgi:2-phosphosulfolactate phosphatase
MNIRIDQGHQATARRAPTRVIIDVIRAFTVADIAFRGGAEVIIAVGTVEEALALRRVDPRLLLAGEVDGLPLPAFDFGNSPWQMQQAPVAGRRLVQRTTNGVAALLANRDAERLLVTGFSQAAATARWLQRALADETAVDLLASHPTGDEDLACADYLRALLRHEIEADDAGAVAAAQSRIRASDAAAKFFDPARPEFDPRDIALCCTPAPEPFAMGAEADGNRGVLLRPLRG